MAYTIHNSVLNIFLRWLRYPYMSSWELIWFVVSESDKRIYDIKPCQKWTELIELVWKAITFSILWPMDRGSRVPLWIGNRGLWVPLWIRNRGLRVPLRIGNRGLWVPLWIGNRGLGVPLWIGNRGLGVPLWIGNSTL